MSNTEEQEVDQERIELSREQNFGPVNEKMVCPHCQSAGVVRTIPVRRDGAISREKLAMAWLTGGITLLTNGISEEVTATQAHCDNCKNTWLFI